MNKPDQYHNHEAVDRLQICSALVAELLIDHPAIAAHPEIQARVLQADGLLMDAYQMMALLHMQDEGAA